jgi:hypothetical protein
MYKTRTSHTSLCVNMKRAHHVTVKCLVKSVATYSSLSNCRALKVVLQLEMEYYNSVICEMGSLKNLVPINLKCYCFVHPCEPKTSNQWLPNYGLQAP